LLVKSFHVNKLHHVILCRYVDAATLMLRLGLAADKCNAVNSQCKVLILSY